MPLAPPMHRVQSAQLRALYASPACLLAVRSSRLVSLTDSILVYTWLSTHCDHRGDSTCFGECLETTAQKYTNRAQDERVLGSRLHGC